VLALPSAAYFLFLEAAVSACDLFWLQSRHDLPRGFILFTSVRAC
jgi:hypothetical protein